ncbi:MAG: TadE/TadG family type IV pilus assembly protein [Paracoccaceae bacterium]
MIVQTSRLVARLASSFRRDNGNATIEFALLFPAFITLFMMVVETGVLLTRGVMLDRAVDMSMRDLRLGLLTPMTHDALKTSICNNSVIIPNCEESILLELRPISTTTWEPLTTDVTCVDRSAEIQPVLEFEAGVTNEMMLVRVCALFDPFFPTSGLAAQIKINEAGEYALVTVSAYVNEP